MPSRELKVQEWIDQIDQGLEFRRRFGLEDLWGEFEAIYYNTHQSMANEGANIFLSQGDAILSTITVPSAVVRVSPVKPEEVDTAPLVETVDNILLREMDVATAIDTACLHCFLFGRGVLKVGYDSEWGYDPEFDIGGDLQLGLTLTQLNKQGTRRIEYDSAVSPGSPWVRPVDPRDFVVPWGTQEVQNGRWAATRLVRQIDDLRADRKYNTRGLEPNMSVEDFTHSYRSAIKSSLPRGHASGDDYVEMYEIMDRSSGKIYVIAPGYDKFLRNDENALQIENALPFASFAFTPRTRAFWTTPDVYYLYHIQTELSDVARQRTKQRRISTLKFLYDSDSLSPENLAKLLSPDVGVAAEIESGRDIQKAIIKLDNTPNQQMIAEEEALRANAREQIGFSRNQLGEFQGGRKTATEVSAVDRSSQLRMSRRGLQVKRVYEDTIRLVNNLCFSYWTLPRYVSILGQQKTKEWMQVNGPMLRGRYDYKIEFTDEDTLEARKREALQLYTILAQDPTIDPLELRNYLTNKLNDPGFERLFNADIRAQMQQLRGGGGNVQSGGSSGGNSNPMRTAELLRQNDQANQQAPTRLLA